ncbi:hypothetical protein PR048_007548 [Dryococelus australis]|uniref:Uncharacterized protein n=1 Tax=Dryococelus australis TaxID=614101 RepID=A0ABQ9HUI9_9NEOP|nr:hypothetical protein PR048_007548 [Dryococelus australis]
MYDGLRIPSGAVKICRTGPRNCRVSITPEFCRDRLVTAHDVVLLRCVMTSDRTGAPIKLLLRYEPPYQGVKFQHCRRNKSCLFGRHVAATRYTITSDRKSGNHRKSNQITPTGTVAKRLVCSPPTKANRIFARRRNRGRRYRWSVSYLEDLPFPPTFAFRRCPILTSPHFTLICSQDLVCIATPRMNNSFTVPSHASDEASHVQLRQTSLLFQEGVFKGLQCLEGEGRVEFLTRRMRCSTCGTEISSVYRRAVKDPFANEQEIGFHVKTCACPRHNRSSSMSNRRHSAVCRHGQRPRLRQSVAIDTPSEFTLAKDMSPANPDKIDVKHVCTKVDFAIGLKFIRQTLDDSEPVTDVQGNNLPGDTRWYQVHITGLSKAPTPRASRLLSFLLWQVRNTHSIAQRAVKLLASHQGEPGSIPGRVTPGFSRVGNVPDDAAGFIGDLPFPPPSLAMAPTLKHLFVVFGVVIFGFVVFGVVVFGFVVFGVMGFGVVVFGVMVFGVVVFGVVVFGVMVFGVVVFGVMGFGVMVFVVVVFGVMGFGGVVFGFVVFGVVVFSFVVFGVVVLCGIGNDVAIQALVPTAKRFMLTLIFFSVGLGTPQARGSCLSGARHLPCLTLDVKTERRERTGLGIYSAPWGKGASWGSRPPSLQNSGGRGFVAGIKVRVYTKTVRREETGLVRVPTWRACEPTLWCYDVKYCGMLFFSGCSVLLLSQSAAATLTQDCVPRPLLGTCQFRQSTIFGLDSTAARIFDPLRFGRFLTEMSCEPMRVIEVSMEQRRNEGAGETGDHRENPWNQGHRPARFPLAKTRLPGRELNPVRLGERRAG